MSPLSFVKVPSVYGFPSPAKTLPALTLCPVYPHAERGISSGIAGRLQDPEGRHRTHYRGARKAAHASPYRSCNIYLRIEACQKGAAPPHRHTPRTAH